MEAIRPVKGGTGHIHKHTIRTTQHTTRQEQHHNTTAHDTTRKTPQATSRRTTPPHFTIRYVLWMKERVTIVNTYSHPALVDNRSQVNLGSAIVNRIIGVRRETCHTHKHTTRTTPQTTTRRTTSQHHNARHDQNNNTHDYTKNYPPALNNDPIRPVNTRTGDHREYL